MPTASAEYIGGEWVGINLFNYVDLLEKDRFSHS